MCDDGEWGPWIDHDGKGCPCVGMMVHIVFGLAEDGSDPMDDDGEWEADPKGIINNAEWVGIARSKSSGDSWDWHPEYYPVIRYRIRKPRAILDMIERARELDKLGELECM